MTTKQKETMHKAVLRNKVNLSIKITEESHKNNTLIRNKKTLALLYAVENAHKYKVKITEGIQSRYLDCFLYELKPLG